MDTRNESLRIRCSTWEQLLNEANDSARVSFWSAVKTIDDGFGEGYAAKHPELIASLVQAAAIRAHGTELSVMLQGIGDTLQALADAVDGVACSLPLTEA